MRGRIVQWRRSAWLWILAGLVALLCCQWGMAHVVRENTSRAIEECGSGCTPLLLFALVCSLQTRRDERAVMAG
jgi:hypothetical protein